MSTGCIEEAPQIKLKEEKIDAELHIPSFIPSSISTVTDTAAAAPRPSSPVHCAAPPTSSLPIMPVVIKQEPTSPIHVSCEVESEENSNHFTYSTIPEKSVAAAAASLPGNEIRIFCYSWCH